MSESMLTTVDNPYDPFTQFDEWNAWDMHHGYHTCSYLARVAHVSPSLSPSDESLAIENAINEIVQTNVNGMYRKVSKKV